MNIISKTVCVLLQLSHNLILILRAIVNILNVMSACTIHPITKTYVNHEFVKLNQNATEIYWYRRGIPSHTFYCWYAIIIRMFVTTGDRISNSLFFKTWCVEGIVFWNNLYCLKIFPLLIMCSLHLPAPQGRLNTIESDGRRSMFIGKT